MGEVLRSGQFYSGSDFIVMKFRKTICAAFELVWKMHRELYLKLILTIKLFFGLHFFFCTDNVLALEESKLTMYLGLCLEHKN